MAAPEHIEVPGYDQSASRIEFCCVRGIYAIPLCIIGGIVSGILGLFLFILILLNNLSVFFLGRRIESLYDLWMKLTAWQVRVSMYFTGLTDERPPLTPL